MKKSIAFIGAMFMSAIAFAQVSKNDNTNNTASRKVMDADVKDLPKDPEETLSTAEIKGEYHQKMKANQSAEMSKGNTIKGTSTQKSSDASAATIKGESTSFEKHTYKMTDMQNKSTSSDPYIKVTSEKKSTATGNTPIKAAGTESQNGTSLNFTKIGDIKGEKDDK
jgi:hypothetical protein